jgi:hypothetical protein
MNAEDAVEVCRQIARDQARGVGDSGSEQSVTGSDPLALIGSVDAYANALHAMAEVVREDAAVEEAQR